MSAPPLTDLDFLVDQWPHLLEERLRGTPRPWQEPPTLTPQRRAELAAQAALERAHRTPDTPGETPAPLHIDVLDVIVDVVESADLLAEAVAQAAGSDHPGHATSAFADPRPHLRYARAWWTQAAEAQPQTMREWDHTVTALAETVRVTLHLVRDGQTLHALCPWCGGRDDTHPVGGGRTLRIHETGHGALIVCHGVGCEPPSADCGERWRGRPAWNLHTEGDWLAKRLAAHDVA